MDHPPEITGHLRRPLRTDITRVHALVTESLDQLSPWLDWCADGYDLASATTFLDYADAGWLTGQAYTYAITDGGEVVGMCGLERRIGPLGLEIGYWLGRDHVGRGLASGSVATLLPVAFGLPGINRVQIWHDSANVRSGAVPARLGFTEIDRRTPPRDPLTSGEDGVDVVWQLTRDQFTARSRSS
ncbi:N-acetyltransferase [Pseudonocardiaceae bacterium YIM PH 21723]|nr:N-acetyltransferase [Pseudonocardiaceae bacterium YIM PH 21723]